MSENNQNQKPGEIKTIVLAHPWKIFAFEAFLFSLALGLGIATAFKLNQFFAVQKIVLPEISFREFLAAFLLVTLFIFLLTHFLKFKKEKGVILKLSSFWLWFSADCFFLRPGSSNLFLYSLLFL